MLEIHPNKIKKNDHKGMKKQSWKYYKNNVIILFRNKIITFLINKIINQYLSLSLSLFLSLSLSLSLYIYIYIWPNPSIYPFFFLFLKLDGNSLFISCILISSISWKITKISCNNSLDKKKKKETCFQPIFKWKCLRNTPKFSFNPYLTSKQFLISQKFQNSSRLKKKLNLQYIFTLAKLRVKHIIWTPIIK
jgi:hypothetical protein